MSTEKRLKRVKNLTKDYGEPSIEPFAYKQSLLDYLNYHNLNTNNDVRRQWAEEWMSSSQWVKDNNIDINFKKVHDREFRSFGAIARLVLTDSYIEEHELEFLRTETLRLYFLNDAADEEEEVDDRPERKETLEKTFSANASAFIAEFEALVDDFTTTWSTPNIQALVVTMGVSSRVAPRLIEYAKKKEDYYLKAIEDKEVFEGYSFSKSQLKKIAGLYSELMDKLSQSKKVRAPKTRKERPAGVLVQNLKHKIEDQELGVRSVVASNIIGASEVYLFRVDSRKLQYFKALDGQTLTVKGTTILNFDEKKSFQKTIRKPELIKNFVGKGKIDSRRLAKEFNSTEGGVGGRTNEETIILSVFK